MLYDELMAECGNDNNLTNDFSITLLMTESKLTESKLTGITESGSGTRKSGGMRNKQTKTDVPI